MSIRKKGSCTKVSEPVVELPTVTPVEYRELSGYFLKNFYVPKAEVNLIVTINTDQLKTNFGVAKTMANKIDTINFDKEAVLGIVLQPTDVNTEVKIDKLEKSGEVLTVHFTIIEGEKMSSKMNVIKLISISKDPDIKQIELYKDGEKKVSEILS